MKHWAFPGLRLRAARNDTERLMLARVQAYMNKVNEASLGPFDPATQMRVTYKVGEAYFIDRPPVPPDGYGLPEAGAKPKG